MQPSIADPPHPGANTPPDLAAATDAYAKRFAGEAGAWMLEVQTGAILALLADRTGTVLDVGGGHAQITPPLLDRGCEVTTLVGGGAAADRLARITGGRAATIVADVCDPDLPENSADIVLALRMMAHVPDWHRFLTALCRIARHAVIVDFPGAGGINRLYRPLFGLKKMIEGNTRPYTRIAGEDIVAAFDRAGFAADARIGQFVVPMVAHRCIGNANVSRRIEKTLRPLAPRFGNPVIMRAVRRTS